MKEVLYQKSGHTGLITLNSPETLNALSSGFIPLIHEALDQAEADIHAASSETESTPKDAGSAPGLYSLIITGCGKAFIAGADIAEMYEKDPDEIFQWSALGSDLNLRLERFPVPVIAAINGYALGGGLELALACDLRIAADHAKLGLPEVSLGVICGAGGTQRLPAIVGEGIAKELIFTGRTIDAQEALRIGLVNKVTPPEALMDEAFALAAAIEKNGPLAVKAAKEAVRFAGTASIEEGCMFERKKFSALFATEDQKTGMGGFLRKEKEIHFRNK